MKTRALSIFFPVCGGHLMATQRVQHLYSHARFGDHNYDNNADCEWTIGSAPGAPLYIQLTFLTFEIEPENDCSYDYVEVFNSVDAIGSSLGKFCSYNVSKISKCVHIKTSIQFNRLSTQFSKIYVLEPW